MLLAVDDATLAASRQTAQTLLQQYLERGIRADEVMAQRRQIAREIVDTSLSRQGKELTTQIAQPLLNANFVLNEKDTEKRQQLALASVEPVRETVKRGQVLVRRGDVVTDEQLHALEELGLARGPAGEIRIFGLSLFTLIVMALAIASLYYSAEKVYKNDASMVLVGLILLLTLLLGKTAHYYSDFAAPLAVGALLATILFDRRVGMSVSLAAILLFGVIVDHDLRAVVTALAGAVTGVYSITWQTAGYSLARSGLWVAVSQFLVVATTGLIDQVDIKRLVVESSLAGLNGIVAAVIATGILPYLENLFHITTSVKLMTLARPDHPLLEQLLLEAPGTYHHSILVGNLAETAAAEIGADPILARVGAYYHDIGKLKRPYFFVENQTGGENPHDKIAPSLSTLIITSHIKDGRDLCREYKLPDRVAAIVQQHHGTTLAAYFYQKAMETEHGECLDEADFRYDGPCPQSREAALVMLADGCEAAVRSIAKPNVNRIEATVRKIIRQRLNDGQLDECNVTLKDLNRIGDVFIRVLSSMFHTRIEYPDEKELERRKVKNGNQHKLLTARGDDIGSDGGNGQEGFKQSS